MTVERREMIAPLDRLARGVLSDDIETRMGGAALNSLIVGLSDHQAVLDKLLADAGIRHVDPALWYDYDWVVEILSGELVAGDESEAAPTHRWDRLRGRAFSCSREPTRKPRPERGDRSSGARIARLD